jgi:hypothetical protein
MNERFFFFCHVKVVTRRRLDLDLRFRFRFVGGASVVQGLRLRLRLRLHPVGGRPTCALLVGGWMWIMEPGGNTAIIIIITISMPLWCIVERRGELPFRFFKSEFLGGQADCCIAPSPICSHVTNTSSLQVGGLV